MTFQYWRGFTLSPNNDGTYTVATVYENGTTKTIDISSNNLMFMIHSSYAGYEYAANIVKGDKLTLHGVYVDKNTIRGSGYILVNGGIPLAPTDITSSNAHITKLNSSTFGGFTEKTTISDAKAMFTENCDYMEIRTTNGSTAANTDILCTGFSVNIIVNNSVKVSYTIVVSGDITGDVSISTADYVVEKKIIKQASSLSGAYALAADIDGDGSVSTMDYVLVSGHISGKKLIGN